MERNDERNVDDLIDLGKATEETKGPGIGGNDGAGEQILMGLTDE